MTVKRCDNESVPRENTLEHGTILHLLLVESLPAFYQWQDAVFNLESQEDFEIKTLRLKRLIAQVCLARGTTYQLVGEEYRDRL